MSVRANLASGVGVAVVLAWAVAIRFAVMPVLPARLVLVLRNATNAQQNVSYRHYIDRNEYFVNVDFIAVYFILYIYTV